MEQTQTKKFKYDSKMEIVELFEEIQWDVLALTDDIECLSKKEYNNINLEFPYFVLPGTKNMEIVVEPEDEEDGTFKFNSVKEVLDFIGKYYLTHPALLISLFPGEDKTLLVALLCHMIESPRNLSNGSSDWCSIFTRDGGRTKFNGIYFNKSGGLVVKLTNY